MTTVSLSGAVGGVGAVTVSLAGASGGAAPAVTVSLAGASGGGDPAPFGGPFLVADPFDPTVLRAARLFVWLPAAPTPPTPLYPGEDTYPGDDTYPGGDS